MEDMEDEINNQKNIEYTEDERSLIEEYADMMAKDAYDKTIEMFNYLINEMNGDFNVDEIAYVFEDSGYDLEETKSRFLGNDLPDFPEDIPKGKFRSNGKTKEQIQLESQQFWKEIDNNPSLLTSLPSFNSFLSKSYF